MVRSAERRDSHSGTSDEPPVRLRILNLFAYRSHRRFDVEARFSRLCGRSQLYGCEQPAAL
eukprot:3115114-Prymnesium_polylepis.1